MGKCHKAGTVVERDRGGEMFRLEITGQEEGWTCGSGPLTGRWDEFRVPNARRNLVSRAGKSGEKGPNVRHTGGIRGLRPRYLSKESG